MLSSIIRKGGGFPILRAAIGVVIIAAVGGFGFLMTTVPAPTETLAPTETPVPAPTFTPMPTYTPYPTPTPAPTYTPQPIPTVRVIVVTPTPVPTPTETPVTVLTPSSEVVFLRKWGTEGRGDWEFLYPRSVAVAPTAASTLQT